MELTNAYRKMVAGLSAARSRRESGLFKAEGTKCVLDTITYFDTEALMATSAWVQSHPQFKDMATVVTARDLDRMSSLSTAPDVIAVYKIPEVPLDVPALANELVVALDSIQDPGNLGTIIRSADWFGVRNILCSKDTVDVYNPKVVQATMGAIARVKVHYCDLGSVIADLKPVAAYGTFLDGENIYDSQLTSEGIIVMGNEGKGISAGVASAVNRRISIPSFPVGEPTSESLNVAVATSIVLAEFRRRQ
ncbi:MAG: RNA methyltransferase [Paramuribaculum sp.]|nr:RNA methyltransferase [Paramuribaculum sp.]